MNLTKTEIAYTITIPIYYDVPKDEANSLHNALVSDIILFKPVVPFKELLSLVKKYATEKGTFTEADYTNLRKQDANLQTT